jgi:SAM-dependent methyltransferase
MDEPAATNQFSKSLQAPLSHKPSTSTADHATASKLATLKRMMANPHYLRRRLSPQPGEPGYLHRADLLLALKREALSTTLTILDYGAGVSPYRALFPNSDYRRADIVDFAAPDYLVTENGTVPEKSGVFDVILSTQVLAHVENPSSYLSECFRLIRPGGRLILSTNSNFADGDCPGDFQRWTAEGLRRDLKRAGFENITIWKLSTGPRAVMFFIERYIYTMAASRKTLPGLLHWVCSTAFRYFRRWIHIQMDRYYSAHQVVSSDAFNHDVYLTLLACARRPMETRTLLANDLHSH